MAASGMQRRKWLATTATAAVALPLAAQQGASSGPLGGTLEQRLALPSSKVQAVLDTDTYNEIDDQFATAYALLSPQHMEIEAIYAAPFQNERSTSAGEGMEKSYEEILRILARLNRKSEGFAYRGSSHFMTGPGKPVDSPAARDLIAKR